MNVAAGHPRLPSERRAVRVCCALSACGGLVLATSCTASPKQSSTAGATATSTAAPAPSSTPAPSPEPSTSAAPTSVPTRATPSGTATTAGPPPPAARPSSAPAGDVRSTVPAVTRSTRPPVPAAATATFVAGVTVHLLSRRTVRLVGQGPGELSGPAVALTLDLRNGSSQVVDLDASQVTAAYADGTPAVASSATPSRPWTGRLAPGGRARGSYVFLTPSGRQPAMSLNISYDPRRPVVLLEVPAR